MSTNNDVFRVMVLPDEAAVTSGHISALGNGNWGLFNASNDTAVDVHQAAGADAANVPDNFYIAYQGDGTLGVAGKIYRSAGQYIQLSNIRAYVQSDVVSPVNQIILVTPNYDQIVGESEYGLRIEFRANTELYERYGYNQVTKSFVSSTNCPLSDVDAAYANNVLADIFEGIVNDADQIMNMTISYTDGGAKTVTYAVGTSGSASGTIAGSGTLAALRALDATAAATLAITVLPLSTMNSWSNINPSFFKMRQLKGLASLAGSRCSWATINNESTPLVIGTNYGYELKELEYEAGGWSGKPGPYRQSALHGLPYADFEYLVDSNTTQYQVHSLQYDHESVAGWMRHKSSITTYFCIVGNGGTGITALNSLMDNIVAAAGVLAP